MSRLPTLLLVSLVAGSLLACSGGSSPEATAPPAAAPAAPPAVASATTPAPPAPAAAPAAAPGPTETSAIPYFAGPIPDSAVTGRSLRELTLMRNTIYARAGNPFRKRWLNAWFSAQGWYAAKPVMDEALLTTTDRANAEKIAKYEASITKTELLERHDRALERVRATLGKASQEEQEVALIELMLLCRALGFTFPEDDTVVIPGWFAEKVDVTPLDDPARLDRLLTVEELRDLSRRDLRLLRNMVYARKGRPFKSALLTEYFYRMEWYEPDPAYTDARLTDTDNRNIQLIRSVEDSIGGPLTDKEQQASDEWFGGA